MRVVARTPLENCTVSTVFLVYDHAFGGPPILFETMVLSEDGYFEEYLYRYQTWEEAVFGHNFVVNCISEKYPKIEPVTDKDTRSDVPLGSDAVRHIRVDNKTVK